MGKTVAVDDKSFQSEVLEAKIPVLVDFWAAWCGPCRMIAPIVEELATEYEGKMKVAKLDVDANQESARQFGVMSIPTLILFKDGKPTARIVGYKPKEQLEKELAPHIGA